MPEPLDYRPSDSAVYYTPPRQFDRMRTIVGTSVAAIGAVIGAIAYAKIQPELSSFYLRGGEVGAGALAVGLLGMFAVHHGKVRSQRLAALIGASIGLLTLYVMWLVWVHDVLTHIFKLAPHYWPMIRSPRLLLTVIRNLNQTGTWAYGGNVVNGGGLLVLWLGEAAAMLASAVMIPIKSIGSEAPVCRQCGAKCTSAGQLPRYDAEQKDALIAAVESRDFASLAAFEPTKNEDDPELTLRLLSCPRCGQMHVLTVSYVAWTVDERGLAKVMANPLVNQLMVTTEEAEQIRNLGKEVTDQ